MNSVWVFFEGLTWMGSRKTPWATMTTKKTCQNEERIDISGVEHDDSAHVHWCHCCIYLDALASWMPGTAFSNCCYLTWVAEDQDRDRHTETKRECFFFFPVIISFLHPSLSQPQILSFFFFYVILHCFSVWSLLSLMLSCVVHRWKTKKEIFYRAFM